jgi:predicted RNA-binding Zn ribbon-like protein
VDSKQRPDRSPGAPRIADHLALDLLNTVAIINGAPVDFLATDADVLRWLEQAGVQDSGKSLVFAPGALVASARSLREMVRGLIAKRKADGHADVRAFNAYLAEAASYPQLVWPLRQTPAIVRLRSQKSPEQLLAPVAEAAADLLENGEFELVRKCEDDGCVLWFYDRTKSHRRRWCSVATCGNRNKVKAFRLRQQA